MVINIYFTPQQYESKFVESALANILENKARLDSTTPLKPNPSLPRTSVKLVHLIDPVNPTKPIQLPHYSPITLKISMDILSSTTTTIEGLSERYLACSVIFPPEIWTTDRIRIPHWPRPPHLLGAPEAALSSTCKLAPSTLKDKSTHVQDLSITVPVEQLTYQTGTDPPIQFFSR